MIGQVQVFFHFPFKDMTFFENLNEKILMAVCSDEYETDITAFGLSAIYRQNSHFEDEKFRNNFKP